MPTSADLALRGLDTETRPFRIDEAGRTDLGEEIAAAHRVIDPHDLAVTLGPARKKTQAQPMTERGRDRRSR